MKKRIIALILTIAMLISALPLGALAAQPEAEQPAVDTGDVSIEGTNGFGTLLSQKITESQSKTEEEEKKYEAGYSVSNLVIEGTVATVTYVSRETALLVVALYTEDGMQMLTSAKTTVTADATEALVEFTGDMPEYFQASAYLVDIYDLSPLCASYDTPMYTQEMQELLASTVEDYDADRVLNLDDDATTNFVVCAETTKMIDSAVGVNTVTTVDPANRIYVIENTDDQISGLAAGDIMVYPYADGDVIVVKIAAIEMDGSAATITGEDLELEEAFDYVKIESSSTTEDAQVDDSHCDEGITYHGVSGAGYVTNGNARLGAQTSLDFDVDFASTGTDEQKVEATGTISLMLGVDVSMYITKSYQRIQIMFSKGVTASLSVKAEYGGSLDFELCKVTIPIGTGISVKFVPKFVLRVSATATFSISYTAVEGGFAEHDANGWTLTGIEEKPQWEANTQFEGEIYAGFVAAPAFSVLGGGLVEATLESETGISLTGKITEIIKSNDDVIHDCVGCIDGDLGLSQKLTIGVEFLKCDKLAIEGKLLDMFLKLADYYICVHHAVAFAWGNCPDYIYKVTVVTVDKEKRPVADAEVTIGDETVATGGDGIAVVYLPEADYDVTVFGNGDTADAQIHVDQPRKLHFVLDPEDDEEDYTGGFVENLDEVAITDNSAIASGEAGSKITWILHASGWLEIMGEGAMSDFHLGYAPWNSLRSKVKWVTIEEGITSIGASSFYGCGNMTRVTIPESVTAINNWVFFDCTALTEVVLPDHLVSIGRESFRNSGITSLTTPETLASIGSSAFYDCDSLQQAYLYGTNLVIGASAFYNCGALTKVEISGSTVSLGSSCFYKNTALRTVRLPEMLQSIGADAFYHCSNLSSINLPAALATVGDRAFMDCASLPTISLPDALNAIGKEAFRASGLTEIVIPASVSSLGSSAFYQCTSLENAVIGGTNLTLGASTFDGCKSLRTVWIEEGVVSIGASCFQACTSLTSVSIPEGVTAIGNDGFRDCKALTDINFPASMTKIGDRAFYNCSALASVMLPEALNTIGKEAFRASGLTSIAIPTSVTSLGSSVFYQCTSLENAVIGGTNLSLGASAFNGCKMLKTVRIEEGVLSIGGNCFQACTSLTSVSIVESVTAIGNDGFRDCTALTSIDLPDGLTAMSARLFFGCSALSHVSMPGKVGSIATECFRGTALTSITVPASVTKVDGYVFSGCSALSSVAFCGDAPAFNNYTFYGVKITAYYPSGNATWTEDIMQGYGGSVTWAAYEATVNEAQELLDEVSKITVENPDPREIAAPHASYGGEYTTKVTDTYILKTASFAGLVPGAQYVIIAMKRIETEDPLAADNLLFIDQGMALEDGTLDFEYVQRENVDISYVVACGASNKNLADAEITFPEMASDGELQVVDPTVVYDGVTLTEGRDYVIVGTVSFTRGGEYTCYIRGVHNYTGLVECSYTVGGAPESIVTYTSASISLAGDIGVNYYVQLSDDIVADEDAYMQFTVAGQTQIVPLSDAVVGTDGTYRFTCKVAAKQMTEEITGQMYLGDDTAVGEAKVYSVKAYCDAAIPVYSQYAAYADLVELMEAMLNYGGYSQTQFGYNTENLANAGMDTTLPTITADDIAAYAHGATGSESGISVASVSLLLESTTTIRFYFSLDGSKSIEDYTFYVDGVETTPVESNGQYYVDKVNVAAKDLDEMVTVTIGGLTVKYCGLSYVRQVAVLYSNYYSEALVNVAKALYAYNQAANVYFA